MAYVYAWIDGERVEVNVAQALAAMAAEFKRVWGYDLLVSSGTRTRAEQAYLYHGWINRLPGFNLAAAPGYSNHEESGPNGPRSVDLRDSGPGAGVTVIGSDRSIWLRDNCHRWQFRNDGYGFSPREAWHFTFNGRIGIPVIGSVTGQEEGDDMPGEDFFKQLGADIVSQVKTEILDVGGIVARQTLPLPDELPDSTEADGTPKRRKIMDLLRYLPWYHRSILLEVRGLNIDNLQKLDDSQLTAYETAVAVERKRRLAS